MASKHRGWRPSGGSVLAAAPWIVIFSGVLALIVMLAITLWVTLRPDPDPSRNAGGAQFFAPPLPSGAALPGSEPAPAPAAPAPARSAPAASAPIAPSAAGTGTSTGPAAPSATRPSPARTTAPATTTAPAAPARDAFTVLQAESFDARSGVPVTTGNGGGRAAGPIGDGNWIRYDDVDFGSTGPIDFLARLSSGLTGGGSGLVQIRLDSAGSTPIGDFAVDYTGGWQAWRSVPGNVARPTGVHDVYLTFSSAQPADFVALDWFTFRR